MIDYETFSRIHDCRNRQGLTITQTARALGLHPQTVSAWSRRPRFEPRRSPPRGSVLDPFKPRITRLLDTHPYSTQQIFQRLREEGYRGGVTILRDYVRRIRPPKRPVYLKLHFAPGECAQVDWGTHGTVTVGNTSRRLSFFVMVLAFKGTSTRTSSVHYLGSGNSLQELLDFMFQVRRFRTDLGAYLKHLRCSL